MARGSYTILDFDEDGRPILPDHFDEPDRHPNPESSQEGMVERVGLYYEQAEEVEALIERALAEGFTGDESEDVADILQGEHDDEQYWLEKNSSQDSDGRGPKNAHWSSGLTYCRRQKYYDWYDLDASEPLTPYQDAIYAFGSAAGKLVATWMAKAGIYRDREEYFRYYVDDLEHPITGKADVVISDPMDGGERTMVEAKSCSQKSFDTFERGRNYYFWGTSDVPRKSNVVQLMSYMVADAGGLDAVSEDDTGYLVYVSKNDHDVRVWRIWFNEQLFRDAIHYAKYLEWHVENEVVPPRHPNGELDLYVRGSQDGTVPAGGIKGGKFPCIWKGGKGRCDHLTRCWADMLAEDGSEALSEEAETYIGEQIKGGE